MNLSNLSDAIRTLADDFKRKEDDIPVGLRIELCTRLGHIERAFERESSAHVQTIAQLNQRIDNMVNNQAHEREGSHLTS